MFRVLTTLPFFSYYFHTFGSELSFPESIPPDWLRFFAPEPTIGSGFTIADMLPPRLDTPRDVIFSGSYEPARTSTVGPLPTSDFDTMTMFENIRYTLIILFVHVVSAMDPSSPTCRRHRVV